MDTEYRELEFYQRTTFGHYTGSKKVLQLFIVGARTKLNILVVIGFLTNPF
jgi:hypothetical protein